MGFYIFISVLILIICILLALIVLIQNPKGGGLSAAIGGGQGNQFMGVRKTADFLEKGTWVLAIGLLVLSLVAAFAIPRGTNGDEQNISTELTVDDMPALPTSPATMPEPAAAPQEQ